MGNKSTVDDRKIMRLTGASYGEAKVQILHLIAERTSPGIVGLSGRGGDGRPCQPRSVCGFAPQYGAVSKHELTFADLFSNNK